MEVLTWFDILYSLILYFFLIFRAKGKEQSKIVSHPYYKYYSKGLRLKLFGAVSFCLIYALYYKGGDTINYYQGVEAMNALLFHDFTSYLEVLFTDKDANWYLFSETGKFPPVYMFRDERTFTVIKLTSIISIAGLGGFMATTILLASIVYNWVWKLFSFLIVRYPDMGKELSVSFLYLPSIVFWGSGILKDTYTFAATCYVVYALDKIFLKKDKVFRTVLGLFVALYLIIIIKSYILFALLPGILIYLNFERINKIKSSFVKVVILPFGIVGIFALLNIIFLGNSDLFGKYAGEKIFEEAAVQQNDLKRSVYGSNSFDIGEFEPTLQGGLGKFHLAVNAALFRPYMWEVGSPTMILSGIENSILLFIVLWSLLTQGPFKVVRLIFKDPFILFCLLFTLILGFGVGLSTANFGALVRYKIPFLPFFVFLVLMLMKKTRSAN